ncbi:hypothetical protein [Streptomyces sp. NPDC060198]|uniref:hypothetical protein n=1 Tax=Streptomyces sp. NPDC060198 TaxID=3347070 RepID=UPI003666ECA9
MNGPDHRAELPVETGARDVVHTAIDEKTYPIRLSVEGLVRGSDDALDGVRLGDGLKGKVPYYLTYEVTNTGKKEIPAPYEVFRNLTVTGTDWLPGTQVRLTGGTARASASCEDSAPDTLAPGASYTSCGTYMLTKGVGVMAVTHLVGGGIGPASQVTTWPVEGGFAEAAEDVAAQGDAITVRWDAGKEDGGIVELPATLESVRKGSPDDLAGTVFDGAELHRTPYYVTISYRNPGETDLSAGQADSVRVITEGGQQIGGIPRSFADGLDIDACPSEEGEDVIPPGGTVEECTVYLTADGDEPFVVGFQVAGEEEGLTGWRAKVS